MSSIEKPIFIHSWFRSGSTYIWSKFRTRPDLICYYEPLHERISAFERVSSTSEAPAVMPETLRHSIHGDDYFFEYESLKGRIRFKPQISYDRYVLAEESTDDDLELYLNSLVNHAQSSGKQALLAFCRSQMRCAWMRKKYDATHIATIRNPLDQFSSFQINMYFIDKIFRTSHSIQRSIPDLFKPISRYHNFLMSIADKTPSQIRSYPIRHHSIDEIFSIFLIVWLLSSLHSMNESNYVVDIDALTESSTHRRSFSTYLASLNMIMEFDDCKIPLDVSRTSRHDKLENLLSRIIVQWPDSVREKLMSLNMLYSDKLDRHETTKLNHMLLQKLRP